MNIDEMVESFGVQGRRRKRWADQEDDMFDSFDEAMDEFEEEFDKKADYSVGEFYPQRYCEKVSKVKTECFDESLLELFANKGAFDEKSDETIASLTKDDIVRKINSGNYR